MLSCYLNERIWKTKFHYNLYELNLLAYMEMVRLNEQKRKKKSPHKEVSRSNDPIKIVEGFISTTYSYKINLGVSSPKLTSLCSTLGIPAQRPNPIADNTTVSFENVTCTDLVDFGKCQDEFELGFWSEDNSNFLDMKLKVFKKDVIRSFCVVQKICENQISTNFYNWGISWSLKK